MNPTTIQYPSQDYTPPDDQTTLLEANIDVDDVGVDNVDDVEVANDMVHVSCPVLLASIIEIKTDDQYKI